MTRIFHIAATAALLASCQSAPENQTAKPPETVALPEKPESGAKPEASTSTPMCYRAVLARDTFSLQLEGSGVNITGRMALKNYEKDSSHGTVTGIEEGGVIRLWYRFQSEGTESMSQVFFKREGSALIRGVGDIAMDGDSAYYKNPVAVTYTEAEKWEPVDCAALKF